MKLLFLTLLIIFQFLFTGFSFQKTFQTEEIINEPECLGFVEAETLRGDTLETRNYCIVEFEQLTKLFHRTKLSYIGSNSNYHFFFLYVKLQYEPKAMWQFAVNKKEFTPKNEFYEIGKIGESPFLE